MRDGTERAWAFVVPAGAGASVAELDAFLRDRLSAWKAPERIVLVAALPVGLSGKIQRDQLRRLAT
jgi:acyl-coenzyme A synthetase/AMP-(fatty) acid ligase